MMSQYERQDLRKRTTAFALRIIRLYTALPKTTEAQVLGKQLLRSGTSVGAHYREAQRAKSDADFINKIEGGLQELEETGYWLELLAASTIMTAERLKPLQAETEELIAIFVTIVKKVKNKPKQQKLTRDEMKRNTNFILHPSAFILLLWIVKPG